MTSIDQENLEAVMIDFFGALRSGRVDDAAALLDPDVTWQGLREDWVCHGRGEVIQTFRRGLDKRRDVDALEFTRAGDQVVLGARGPSITEVAGEPLEGQIFNVFTLRDGRIVRIVDYRAPGRSARCSRRHRGRRPALITGEIERDRAPWVGRALSFLRLRSPTNAGTRKHQRLHAGGLDQRSTIRADAGAASCIRRARWPRATAHRVSSWRW